MKETILKFTINTPKGRAEKDVAQFKDALAGFSQKRRILLHKKINAERFELYVLCDTPKDEENTIKKAAKAEAKIKGFYRTMIKVFDKVNRLVSKGKIGRSAAKRVFLRLMQRNGYKDADFLDKLNVEEDTFIIKDREDILRLIGGDIITVERANLKSNCWKH